MKTLLSLLRNLFRQNQVRRELDEELESCLEMLAQQRISQGVPENLAWREARLEMGGMEQVKEAVRDVRRGAMIEQICRDLRYALRTLGRSPGFTIAAVSVLAVGLGLCGAMFGLYDLLLRNPYRFPDAGRLVDVQAAHISGKNSATGYADYLDWRDQNSSFEEMAIEPWVAGVTVTGAGDPKRATVCLTTASFVKLIGLSPNLGRSFLEEEDQPGAPHVMLLSSAVWRSDFGMDHEVTGRTIKIDDVPHAVIGVVPERFQFPGMARCDYWGPLRQSGSAGRYQHQYGVWAKLKRGVSLERAQADMIAIARRLEAAYPATNKGWGVKVRPLAQVLAMNVRTPLTILGASVAFVLILVCVNVAGLLLARGAARAGEMAIRVSLGAGRGRLMSQVLTESLLLGLLAGVAGLLVAWAAMRFFVAVSPSSAGLEGLLEMTWPVAAFAMVLSLAASLLFGVLPALHGSNADWNVHLKGGGSSRSSLSRSRWLAGLVVAESALSLTLLAGVGLLAQGLHSAFSTDLGLRSENVLTFGLDLPATRYSATQTTRFYDDLLDTLRQGPGVAAAGAIGTLPMTGSYSGTGIEVEGRAIPEDWVDQMTQLNEATSDYFNAIGIRILRGRPFDRRDTPDSERVIAVDETFARRYFAGEEVVGKRVRFRSGDWMTIVAVVGAIRHQQPMNAPVPQLYRPHTQGGGPSWVVLRSVGDPEALAGYARRAVAGIDASLPLLRMRTMKQVVSDSLAEQRILTSAGLISAAFALLLCAMGTFGLVAYSVARRRHELGVRMALGASRLDILGLVTGQSVRLILVGAAIGLPGALISGKGLASQLAWVKAADAYALLAALTVLLAASIAASFIPARRAASVNPVDALRAE